MKRNTLTTAVLAGLTGMAGMVSVSNAVNVNPDGLGQVLLYPYYTARGGNDTLISIVNTTDRGKAVKVRFIEALNSREVLDFNVYMSPFDVWTAAVTATDDGGGKMITTDRTCTVRDFVREGDGVVGEQAFLNFQYTGGNSDAGPQGIERTASGYIEVIEMGTMVEQPGVQPAAGSPALVPWWAKHVSDEPRNCAAIQSLWTPGSGTWAIGNSTFGFDTVIGASGGLFGSASIINVPEGTMFAYNATAIDGFWAPGSMSHTNPGDLFPDLGQGDNDVSNVFVNGGVQTHDWSLSGVSTAAVNATLTYDRLMNEYTIEEALGGRSEWVLTFPTKRFHTDAAPGGSFVPPGVPTPPFTQTWQVEGHQGAPFTRARSCEALNFTVWNREERTPGVDDPEIIISPPPPPEAPDVFQLCREANVVRFTNTGGTPDQTEILKETLRASHPALSYTNFQLPEDFSAGWVRFNFTDIPAAVGGGQRTSVPGQNTDTGLMEVYTGLPVIGFWANTFTNGDLGGLLSNYGGSFDHRGSRNIESAGF